MDRLVQQRQRTKAQRDRIYADLEKQRVRIKEIVVPPIPVSKVAKQKSSPSPRPRSPQWFISENSAGYVSA